MLWMPPVFIVYRALIPARDQKSPHLYTGSFCLHLRWLALDMGYKIWRFCFDVILVVKMPSPQYYIELDNTTVASFDTASSTAEGLVYGSTEVKLKGHSILFLTALSVLSVACHIFSLTKVLFQTHADIRAVRCWLIFLYLNWIGHIWAYLIVI